MKARAKQAPLPRNTLTVTDNRTGQSYELPIEHGAIRARDLPLLDWPDKLFAQDWSLPAMSALVSRTPGRAYVLADKDYLSNPPFDPACGTLPRLSGYHWGGPG